MQTDHLRIKSAYQQMKLRKMESHSSGVWDDILGVTITNSCSFSPGALPSHVCCPLSYCHLVFGIRFSCERKRQKPPISSLFCQPTNQPPFSWCSAKFKISNLAVWFMQLRPGSDGNNKVRCQRISCCCFWGVKTTVEAQVWTSVRIFMLCLIPSLSANSFINR